MGISNQKISTTELKLIDYHRYKQSQQLEYDERYGQNIKIYQDSTSSHRITIITKHFDPQIVDLKLNMQQKIKQLRHPALLQLLNIHSKTKKKLCN